MDQLAFYQPSAFGDRGGQIEVIAQVRGHELNTRGELPKEDVEHLRVKDEYYNIQIGILEKLKEPPTSGNGSI